MPTTCNEKCDVESGGVVGSAAWCSCCERFCRLSPVCLVEAEFCSARCFNANTCQIMNGITTSSFEPLTAEPIYFETTATTFGDVSVSQTSSIMTNTIVDDTTITTSSSTLTSLSVESASSSLSSTPNENIMSDDEALPWYMFVIIAVAGVCCLLLLIGVMLFVVRSKKQTQQDMNANDDGADNISLQSFDAYSSTTGGQQPSTQGYAPVPRELNDERYGQLELMNNEDETVAPPNNYHNVSAVDAPPSNYTSVISTNNDQIGTNYTSI